MSLKSITYCLVLFLLIACKDDAVEELSCDQVLFGVPNINTGLIPEVCKQICDCKGYGPKVFSEGEIASLKQWELTIPFPELTTDPYKSDLPEVASGVCAVIIDDVAEKKYHLQSFPNEAAATAAGAILTHDGPCNLCSTLQDLTVYLEFRDLGTIVRNCSFQNLLSPIGQLVDCLEDIGFSTPCAQIWAYNAKNTQQKCWEPCIEAILSEALFNVIIPYNNEDGSLSPCIECDELISGPIFKAYAGRTRRNSGIPSGICRFCDGVVPIAHDYPF